MKLILLHPNLDSMQQVIHALEKAGHALLYPADGVEAYQLLQLHGRTIDLAIVHRETMFKEADKNPLSFVKKFKSDPLQEDLPYILTTDEWDDSECVAHQGLPEGANAYLRTPFNPDVLVRLVQSICINGSDELEAVMMPPPFEEAQNSFGLQLEPPRPASDVVHEVLENSEILDISSVHVKAPQENLPEPAEAELSMLQSFTNATGVSPAPTLTTTQQTSQEVDEAAESQMPYLFGTEQSPVDPRLAFARPIGNAIVPGGAAQSPDAETLKKYLLLREQDVSALSAQLKISQERIDELEENIRREQGKNVELEHVVNEHKSLLENFETLKNQFHQELQKQVEDLQFKLKTKTDKIRILEGKIKEAMDEKDRIRDRVRKDLLKIRTRERELENRLEIMKKDSEVLVSARENKIIELKRKLDLVEFNMDLLQDQYAKEKEQNDLLKARLERAARAMKVAGGFLDESEMDDLEAEAQNPEKSTQGDQNSGEIKVS